MPSKPSPKRRPRVAGTRPGNRPSPSGDADSALPEEYTAPAETGDATAAAEAPAEADTERTAETRATGGADAAPPTGAEAEGAQPEQDEQALPEEIASAARIERGEPEPEDREEPGAAERPAPTARHAASPEEPAEGTGEPAAAAGGDGDTDGPDGPDGDGDTGAGEQAGDRSARPPVKLAVVLTVVALLLGGFAAFAALRWGSAAQTTGNRALTDADTTRQVTTQVSGALNTLLAFDYKHPDQHDKAAKRLIDGKLADCTGQSGNVGYKKLMDVLRKKGPQAQLTLKSSVIKSGVQQLRGDRAQLLVLLNQQYSKGDGKDAQHSSALAAAVVHAIHKDGRWQLTALCLQ